MSEPPDRKNVLPYEYKPPYRQGLAIGVNAVMGAIITIMLIGCGVFAAGFAAMTMQSNADSYAVLAVAGMIIVATTIFIASRFHRIPNKRGWAIGIYIGLGIGCLLLGLCGFAMDGLKHI